MISYDQNQIDAIAKQLLKERLIVSAKITVVNEAMLIKGQISKKEQYLLLAKTKALLFPVINKRLNETFPVNLPEIFSTPIVDMDWHQADKLVKRITKL